MRAGEFYSLLVVDLACYRLVTVKEVVIIEEVMGLNLCGNMLGSMTGKTETGGGVGSKQLVKVVHNRGYIKYLHVC